MSKPKRDIESFKPKMDFTDYVFVSIGVIYSGIAILAFVGLLGLLMCGCGDGVGPEAPDMSFGEAEDTGALAPPERVLSALELYAPNQDEYYSEGGIAASSAHCYVVGGALDVRIEGLHTQRPQIVGLGGSIDCDPMEEDFGNWSLHCENYHWCEGCFPTYWNYYDFYIEKFGWDEKEYVGWAFWTADIAPFFWCVVQSRITDIVPEYTWQ